MQCPNCQHANPSHAAFCMNCGTPLVRACANCGTTLPAGARFCMNCGQPAADSSPADEARLRRLAAATPEPLAHKMRAAHVDGERKLVSVLFADVVGSTALAEQMDPEEWTVIMNRAFERLSPAIHRYEGTIARLMGDALLAFFGAPVIHEDDPVRAIRAALDLLAAAREYADEVRREHGVEFAVRVGLNSGTVVVGAVGSDLKYEYTAMGDAVNLAARMQTAAEPGTVLITDNTRRLAAPFFEFEDRGLISIKGKAEPVRAYRVVGGREGPIQARGITGLTSPLVGRDPELQTLRGAIEEMRRGRGRIVSVMGEAGLGKSRLVAELRSSSAPVAGGAGELRWLEGRSQSYEAATPYAPFADMLSGLFELRALTDDVEKYARIRSAVAALAPGDAEAVAPFLASLLDVAVIGAEADRVRYLEPPQLRARVFQAVHQLIERLAAARPLVVVFEDLHWVDPTSLDLLEQLLPLTGSARLMILALFRPHRHEPAWRFHELAERDHGPRYTAIALRPLDEGQSRELVANLLEIEDLPESVRALILAKAEGNPFFVEEVIRSLLDAGLVVRHEGHWRATRHIATIAVPDTLVGVITARLDRLDDDSKRTAQTAAVIGREFQRGVLERVHEAKAGLAEALDTLQRRELIRDKDRLPGRAYLFKHVLTQETAYASILLSRRRQLHRGVAECLEQTEPERAGEIARHFLEAQEMARALPHLVEAADRAARAYSTPEAIEYYSRALDILKAQPDSPLARRIFEGLGAARLLSGDMAGAVENYQAMRQAGEARGDIPMQVSALNKLAQAVVWMGQMHEAEQHLLQAESLARQFEDRAGLAEMFTVRCEACSMVGDFPRVAQYMGESIQLGRQLNIKEQMAYGLTHMTNALTNMTRFDEARATAREALQLVDEIGHLQFKAELLMYAIPFHRQLDGDLDAARQAAEEGLEIAARIGLVYGEAVVAYMLGSIAHLRGEYQRAIAHYERALRAAQAGAPPFLAVLPLGGLGSAYLDISPALSEQIDGYHEQALGLLDTPMGQPAGGSAWADIGFCLLAHSKVDRASELFRTGLSTPTQQGLINRSRFLIGQANVALARNQPEEAARLVSEARQYIDERAMRHLEPEVAFAEGRVCAARGERERAVERLAQAEASALGMTMRPLVWRARAGAARLLADWGRGDEADAKRRAARAMVDEIAGLFDDDRLRALFVDNAMQRIDGTGVSY